MNNIISLMTELHLSDETITNTISKISIICSKHDYQVQTNEHKQFSLTGNGNN